jgi:hypothetical protein
MWFTCDRCAQAYLVGGNPDEIRYLLTNSNYPCITPQCTGVLWHVSCPGDNVLRNEIPLKNFYRAIHGFGTGLGEPASIERVRELLLHNKVTRVVGSNIGQPERTIIECLWLEDGTRLHFASSTKGACIYNVEAKGPSCFEVVDHELRREDTCRFTAEDREEARRAVEAGCGCKQGGTGKAATPSAATDGGKADMPDVPTGYIVPGSGGC